VTRKLSVSLCVFRAPLQENRAKSKAQRAESKEQSKGKS
jgi:hypothetical protein